MTFEELLDQYEPRIAAAFREAIEAIRSTVILARVVERLERGDVAGALDALQIDKEAFSLLEIALQEAFTAGGAGIVAELPRITDPNGNRIVFSFGVRNYSAEQILRELSASMVTHIANDQREGIRFALQQGLSRGQNPRSTALDIIGRQNPVTRRREGGIIGLTRHQIEFIERARANLASGDPKLMRQYLSLATRDKRFDRSVTAAINAGKPVPVDMLTKIIGRLSDRNLKLRGEMLARTETMMALGSAREEGVRQQINSGKVQVQDVTKTWRTAGDKRVRHTHQALNGKSVGVDESFTSLSGASLRFPGDPRAPISEISGCRCWLEYKIDYIGAAARRYRASAV